MKKTILALGFAFCLAAPLGGCLKTSAEYPGFEAKPAAPKAAEPAQAADVCIGPSCGCETGIMR